MDNLITELTKHITSNSDLKIAKVVKAGSFAEVYNFEETVDDPIDVDIVFYISNKNVDDSTLDNLNDLIYTLLTKILSN